jgi:hypothetical protein
MDEMNERDLASRGEHQQSAEEVDDQFRALMEGLRTTIPGVMVMFSFLLVLPFQTQFIELSTVNTIVYYMAFGSAASSAILLMAPGVHQRVRAPISGIKRRQMSHVMAATRLAIVGTGFFLVSIVSVVYLVSSLVLGGVFAAVAGGIIALVAVWSWFFLPLVRFESS